MNSSHATASLGLVLFLGACAESVPEPPRQAVRDSVGIRVIELEALPDGRAFSLERVYSHGWGPDDFEFGRIHSGALLSTGEAALGDLQLQQLVMLDSVGQLDTIIGQPGEGPAEFGALVAVVALPGDTLYVEDDGNFRVVLLHDGEWIRTYSTAGEVAAMMSAGVGVTGDRVVSRPTSYRLYFEEDWLRAPITVHTLNTSRFDSIGSFDYPSKIERDRPNPLRPFGSIGVGQGHALVTRGDRTEVRFVEVDSGRIEQILRWPGRDQSLTDEIWETYAETRRDGTSDTEAELAEQRGYVAEPLPEVVRAFGDDLGRLWVRRWAPQGGTVIYDLFDSDLSPMGTAALPSNRQILDVRGNLVLARAMDEFDVQAVELYRISEGTDEN